MEGAHLQLVKEIPGTCQNSDFICGSLFGILRSVRLQKILGNQQDVWGLCITLDMKRATTIRQRIKIQSTSSDHSSGLDTGTLVQKRSIPMNTQNKGHKSMIRS